MTETVKNHNGHLTSGHLLVRNAVWNLIGSGAPMLVAIFCIPILMRGLGKERFGVLTLAWALIGYASLFDLGLGRALTQFVVEKLSICSTALRALSKAHQLFGFCNTVPTPRGAFTFANPLSVLPCSRNFLQPVAGRRFIGRTTRDDRPH